jgi:hypothetical protein
MSDRNELDLDISNYNLNDILKLFHIENSNSQLSLDDMKKAKKIVLMTHPDKSNLNTNVYLFFGRAYKILQQIYDFKTRSNCPGNKSYDEITEDNKGISENEQQNLVNKFSKTDNFNKQFNKIFEENRLQNESEDSGYGNWLKSSEGLENKKINSLSEMNAVINDKKKELKSLVVNREIGEIKNQSGCSLTTKKPDEYSSDIFSKLPYEDLQKAHTETVIPVDQSDFDNKQKFNSVHELNTFRNSQAQNTNVFSLKQSKDYLKSKEQLEEHSNTERAYELARQSEQAEKANKSLWGHLRQIQNR